MKKLIVISAILFSTPALAQTYMGGFQSPDGTTYISTYDSQQSSRDSSAMLQQQQAQQNQRIEQQNNRMQMEQRQSDNQYEFNQIMQQENMAR